MNRNKFCVDVLATGSKGNATLISYKNTLILIDAGISAKRITEEMKRLGRHPLELDGIFLTHEHSDHVCGLAQMLKQYETPVFCKSKTWQRLREVSQYDYLLTELQKPSLSIGDLQMNFFNVHHDAIDPIGFTCYGGNHKLSVVTDTGCLDGNILGHMAESTMLVLEANYDLELLKYGPYPLMLKRRVAGPRGHLSNEIAVRALLHLYKKKGLQVILAHRSDKNNTEETLAGTMNYFANKAGIRLGYDIHVQYGQQKQCTSMEGEA